MRKVVFIAMLSVFFINDPVFFKVITAKAQASCPDPVVRTTSSQCGDGYNIKALGAGLSGNTLAQDEALLPTVLRNNVSVDSTSDIQSRVVDIPAGRWPTQTTIPTQVGDTDFVNVLGRLALYPYFPVSQHGIGLGVPYFGDGVLAETHGAMDGGNLQYARVDSHGTNRHEYKPVASFTLVGDTPNEPGNFAVFGQQNVVFNHITTGKNKGDALNVYERGRYMGLNGYAEFDVNHWNDVQNYGTDWVWGNLVTMNEGNSFSSGDGPISPSWLFENDMSGLGPEASATAYDPSASWRKMFWMTTNHAENNDNNDNPELSWAANTLYPAGRLILRSGHAGSMMYRNTSGNATSGSTMPAFPTQVGATVRDGGITWQNIGVYTFDIGCLICIGGASDSGHHERIGTVMAESTDLIYNAIFDFSEARFDPSVGADVFARLQSNMYLDLSADGTKSGQNNHLFGYSSKNKSLDYAVNRNPLFQVTDTGDVHIANRLYARNGTVEIGTRFQADEDVLIGGKLTTLADARVRGGLRVEGAASARTLTVGGGNVITTDASLVQARDSKGNPLTSNRMYLQLSQPDIHVVVDARDLGLIVRRVVAPASSTAACHEGDIAKDTRYFYMCISTNTWKRSALESW